MTTNVRQKLLEKIDETREASIGFLQKMIAIPSVTGDEAKIQKFLADYLAGIGLRAQGKTAEARKEFEAALALAPGYVEPLGQLASMAVVEKQLEAALSRVSKQIALVPTSGGFQYLLGVVHLGRREPVLVPVVVLLPVSAPRLGCVDRRHRDRG